MNRPNNKIKYLSGGSIRFLLLLIFSLIIGRTSAQQITSVQVFVATSPPPLALEWLKDPSVLRVMIINSLQTSSRIRVSAVVDKSGTRAVTASWTKSKIVDLNPGVNIFYINQLWDNNSFDVNLSAVNLASGKLYPGSYNICVTVHNPNGIELSSKACASFLLTEYQEPTLLLPTDNSGFSETAAIGKVFQWKAVAPVYPKPVRYQFEMYEVNNGVSDLQALAGIPIVRSFSYSNSYVWTDAAQKINQRKQLGSQYTYRYIWRVRAFDATTNQPIGKNEGENLGYSELRSFTVIATLNTTRNVSSTSQYQLQLIAPANEAYVDPRQGYVNLSWTKTSGLSRVEIYEIPMSMPFSSDFRAYTAYTRIGSGKTYSSSTGIFRLPLSMTLNYNRKYLWRVRFPNGQYSNHFIFTTKPVIVKYKEPTLVYPTNNTNVQWTEAVAGIDFKWNVVSPFRNGVRYWVKLYDATSQQLVKSGYVDQDNHISIKLKDVLVANKSYEWEIIAMDKNTIPSYPIGSKTGTQQGYSERGKFTVLATKPEVPTLVYPSNGAKIAAIDFNSGVHFKWNSNLNDIGADGVFYKLSLKINNGRSIEVYFDTTVRNITELTLTRDDMPAPRAMSWNVQVMPLTTIRKGSLNRIFYTDATTSTSSNFELTDCDGNKKVISNKGMQTGADLKNKFVKIGNFSMLVTEINQTGSTYKGKGSIVVAWLKSALQVEFEGLQINTALTVTSGEVHAVRDENISDVPRFLKGAGGGKLTKENAKKVKQKLNENKSKKLIADQDLDDNIENVQSGIMATLPLGINNLFGYTIMISEMKFTPSKNTLVCMATLPFDRGDGTSDDISFAATNIEFSSATPSSGGASLVLLENFNIVNPDNNSYGVTFIAGTDYNSGTYIKWGCKGFENLMATVDVAFPRDWLTPIKEEGDPLPDEKVVGRAVADITNLKDWILSLSINPCEINGLDGVELSVNELVFDNSDSRNVDGMKFPSGYVGDKGNTFKGFYLKGAQFVLPKFYNKGTDTTGIALSLDNFIITKMGVTGNVKVGDKNNPLINLSSGNVGDFQASIECVEIDIVSKSIKKAAVTGQLVLPITKSSSEDKNAINYEASWTAANKKKGATTQITISPDGNLNTDLIGGAVLDLEETSVIELVYVKSKKRKNKGTVTAKVELNGELSLEKKVDKLELSMGMRFEKLGFNYDNSKTKGKLAFNKDAKFAFASPQKKVAGFGFTISEMSLTEAPEIYGFEAVAQLQMKIAVNVGDNISGSTRLLLKGGVRKENNIYKPAFLSAGIDSISISAKLAAVDLSGTLVYYNGDAVYGDGFWGKAKAVFKKAGELKAEVRFGSIKQTTGNFKYWYADAQMILKNAVPMVGPLGFKGAGVAAWYHMKAGNMPTMDVSKVNNAKSDVTSGSSGASFSPNPSVSFGFNITGIFVNTKSDKTFNGDVAFGAEFNSSGGINYLKLSGSGFIGAGLDDRTHAPIKGNLVANYDFTTDIFDLNVKVDIKYPTVGIVMIQTTEQATLALHVEKNKGGGEPLWYLHVGTPTVPNRIKYYGINSWSYFRAGNNLITNSSFQPVTLAGLQSVDPSFRSVPEPVDENAKGGKGFDFGIGFNKSGGVSVGPFSGSFSVGAELNLCMEQFGPDNGCVTDDFNYWYARGGIAAWATASVGFKGLVSASLGGAGMMQAGAPDPIWAKGRVAGNFRLKVIFITINIRASVPFTYGTVCRPRRTTGKDIDADELLDMDMNDMVEIGEFAMHNSGYTDRMTPVQVVSLFGCRYVGDGTYTYETKMDVMENGVKVQKIYTVDLQWFVDGEILANPGADADYPGSPKGEWSSAWDMRYKNGVMKEEGDGYSLGTFFYYGYARNKRFIYSHYYNTWVTATLMVKNAQGNWEPVKNKNGQVMKTTTKKVGFTTHGS
ncbi:MAG: hypothetical protein GC181_10225 [Bacteroidetes bacterium]|nr:hypothetical protein [Bacteroidota bacterium]